MKRNHSRWAAGLLALACLLAMPLCAGCRPLNHDGEATMPSSAVPSTAALTTVPTTAPPTDYALDDLVRVAPDSEGNLTAFELTDRLDFDYCRFVNSEVAGLMADMARRMATAPEPDMYMMTYDAALNEGMLSLALHSYTDEGRDSFGWETRTWHIEVATGERIDDAEVCAKLGYLENEALGQWMQDQFRGALYYNFDLAVSAYEPGETWDRLMARWETLFDECDEAVLRQFESRAFRFYLSAQGAVIVLSLEQEAAEERARDYRFILSDDYLDFMSLNAPDTPVLLVTNPDETVLEEAKQDALFAVEETYVGKTAMILRSLADDVEVTVEEGEPEPDFEMARYHVTATLGRGLMHEGDLAVLDFLLPESMPRVRLTARSVLWTVEEFFFFFVMEMPPIYYPVPDEMRPPVPEPEPEPDPEPSVTFTDQDPIFGLAYARIAVPPEDGMTVWPSLCLAVSLLQIDATMDDPYVVVGEEALRAYWRAMYPNASEDPLDLLLEGKAEPPITYDAEKHTVRFDFAYVSWATINFEENIPGGFSVAVLDHYTGEESLYFVYVQEDTGSPFGYVITSLVKQE